MPIQFDTPNTASGAGASQTFAHTVTNQNDRVLIVKVSTRNSAGQTVTGVTYNGVAMFRHAFLSFNNMRAELWYLVAPSVGTFNVVVTFSANTNSVCGTNSFFGVDQITPIGNAFSASANSNAPGVNVTLTESVPTTSLVCDVLAANEVSGFSLVATVGAGQTQAWNLKTAFSPAGVNPLGAASRRFAAASPQAMSWSLSSVTDWALIGSYLRPSRARIAFNAKGAATGNFSPAGPFDFKLEDRLRNLESRVGRHDYRLRD